MRLLVVEDNPKMAASLHSGLTDEGFQVEVAETGHAGEQSLGGSPFDLVILDLMLPDRDGLDICRSMRQRGMRTPILMLSALSTTRDKVAGLDSGADDYLAKPFEFDELVSRVRALLRRRPGEASVVRCADLELDMTRRVARRNGESISLTNKEFALLEFFFRNVGVALSRQQIGESVWEMSFDPGSNVIDVYVSMLRRKIDRGAPNPLIHTVVGTGYLFGEQRP